MLSRNVIRTLRPALQSAARQQQRPLSVTAAKMAEGDTGGVKPGGSASSDAFSRREQADENYYVKLREREKLLALKEKIAEQQKHLKELENHIDELSAESSGQGEQKH